MNDQGCKVGTGKTYGWVRDFTSRSGAISAKERQYEWFVEAVVVGGASNKGDSNYVQESTQRQTQQQHQIPSLSGSGLCVEWQWQW